MSADRARVMLTSTSCLLALGYAACGVRFDSGSSGAVDKVEQGAVECKDGIDNDRDGLVRGAPGQQER